MHGKKSRQECCRGNSPPVLCASHSVHLRPPLLHSRHSRALTLTFPVSLRVPRLRLRLRLFRSMKVTSKHLVHIIIPSEPPRPRHQFHPASPSLLSLCLSITPFMHRYIDAPPVFGMGVLSWHVARSLHPPGSLVLRRPISSSSQLARTSLFSVQAPQVGVGGCVPAGRVGKSGDRDNNTNNTNAMIITTISRRSPAAERPSNRVIVGA
ncbi:hypothetical protein HDK77DRAFT_162882 [Phyllosticta capitalensis]|uniref:Uncharacterized protein n=1 Tax=Phyllosticta capitalensis TaxID=121624 RepID=A0ABR1YTF3_9PEZI